MAVIFTDRLAQISYQRARRLLLLTGVAVLAVVVLVTYIRRVETVEVVATLLFLPIFLAFVLRGVIGGVVMGVLATILYAVLRYPAMEAIGGGDFAGLLVSRGAAFMIFGFIGGWSTQVLEGSLTKLEMHDEVDDETGLYNARFLLDRTDLEMARARRYQTLFSLVVLELPTAPFNALSARHRRNALRDLGRALGQSVRTVDHVVHVRDGDIRWVVAVLPETASPGAAVFEGRFAERILAFLADRGVRFDTPPVPRHITFPGDDDALEALRTEFRRIDASQHR